ncbi:Peptidase family M48 [Catalinimonas alkaloidigena]|uniref:Peptidase family M48 n=1 Tax=Catalinimonas alkaloidigena TaxID=1075417 RepID=A0A1G9HXN0_9BACT|nr:M48 family metalloprotease [Catalinimonas alkaloidigena]SDL17566.1 Peptidase family M48 [Catalinimonas alkaloidigena]
MQKTITYVLGCVLTVSLALTGCDRNGNLNILSVEDDKQLGAQLDEEIQTSGDYKILSENDYPEAYQHIRRITNNILNSGQVPYQEEFAWKVTLIRDDTTLNAFATPGGYIYVYTGLIKYLDAEDQLAGVLSHEIGHAALRHTSRNLTKEYGIDVLLQIVLGEQANNTLAQIARSLNSLRYSRDYEREADDASVVYLSQTPQYECDGAAGFFIKLEEEGNANPPEFLSTHPNPENRIEAIQAKATELKCSTELQDPPTYQELKNSLP